MSTLKKIKEILYNSSLSIEDKLLEIQQQLPENKDVPIEMFGIEGRKVGNSMIFDGSLGYDYIDNPELDNPDDIYYSGCGCTWDTDKNGNRYWKLYSGHSRGDRFHHLDDGDIINNKARTKKMITDILKEMGIA